jgi:hypothetical protein
MLINSAPQQTGQNGYRTSTCKYVLRMVHSDNILPQFLWAMPTLQLNVATVGSLPDMLTFTPDDGKVLVAKEGDSRDDNGYSEEAL